MNFDFRSDWQKDFGKAKPFTNVSLRVFWNTSEFLIFCVRSNMVIFGSFLGHFYNIVDHFRIRVRMKMRADQ